MSESTIPDPVSEFSLLQKHLTRYGWTERNTDRLNEIRAYEAAHPTPVRDLLLNAVDNALEDVRSAKYARASLELEMIRWFDRQEVFADGRYERHFFGTVLSTYLREVDDVERMKRATVLVGELVSRLQQDVAYRQRRERLLFHEQLLVPAANGLMWPMPGYDAKAEGPKSYVLERYDGEVAWEATIDWRTTSDYYERDEIWDEAGLVVVSHGGEVCGLDLGSGAILHQFSVGAQLKYVGVQREKGRLVLVSDESVWCLDEAFHVLWHTDLGANSVSFKHIDGDRLLLDVHFDDADRWERLLLDVGTGDILKTAVWRAPERVEQFPSELARQFERLIDRLRGSRLMGVRYWHPKDLDVVHPGLDTGLVLVELVGDAPNSLFIGRGAAAREEAIALHEALPLASWLDYPHEAVDVSTHAQWMGIVGDVVIDAKLQWGWLSWGIQMEYPKETPTELFPPEAVGKMWGDRPYTHSARSYYLQDLELTLASGRRVYICTGKLDDLGEFQAGEGPLNVLFDDALARRFKLGSFGDEELPA